MQHLGLYKTRRLPHVDMAHRVQAITYRLADSLPDDVVKKAEATLGFFPPEELSERRHAILHSILDKGLGSCILRHPACAKACITELEKHDGKRYDLLAWVVMPNHAHVLIRQYEGWPLGAVVGAWKGAASRTIGQLRLPGAPSPLWQRDFWDRYAREPKHLGKPIEYILQNPVKAGLCRHPKDWPWKGGSALADHAP